MKRILVTGGTGYIGSHTVVQLIEHGYEPVIIDNFSNSDSAALDRLTTLIKKPLPFYEGDIGDKSFLESVLQKESIDGVIHFAAFKAVGVSMEKPLDYYRNNIDGMLNLLECMRTANVTSIVFSSSCTVYGEPDHVPVDETAPMKPAESTYGHTKQVGEDVLRFTAQAPDKPLRAISLRYFNPIGAHPSGKIGELVRDTPGNLLPYLMQAAAGERDHLTVFGDDYETPDGTCIRDYIHVVDLANAHIAALEHLSKQQAPFNDVFNIGTGTGSSVLELIRTFEEVTGQKVPYVIGERRAGDIVSSYAAANKANTVLGWKAERDLKQSLKDAWNWQQSL